MTDDRDMLIPLIEAAKYLPGRGRTGKVHVNTIYRWIKYGYRGTKLKACKVGITVCTTRRWIDEFIAAMNMPQDVPLPTSADFILNQAGV